ncbi:sigma-70 family RNA polymerase sigma factor [Aurantimonas sp. VKM B-3413]|uniref:sigma-70 family RNA polymerase sigma factor n=1 Tax=Aurantimonas sp. VKM B-3413 TaxID=2779401 RepID=UPI001E340DA2|nr:sigma-70 family RNA polymerase sigma factor [Aurantimonas sp. VKM B-3413]MCB8840797.1 sigma-70 family RNA polymerase sigma factor [Aurantimonas sp. VKM B-3413]
MDGSSLLRGDEGRAYLVERLGAVAAGDRAALADLYQRTSGKLFGICLRILKDREEAEDVLQDVYLTIWNRADRYDGARASPITWLATITRNRAIDRLRALGPRPGGQPIEDAGEVADDSPDALELLGRSDEARRLSDCLGEVDDRTRSAITDAFFGGLTYEELAHRAGMPLGTMKSLIRRGLVKLKGCLSR